MAAAFASATDLAARWRPLTPAEETMADTLLGDASLIVRSECPDVDARLSTIPPALDPDVPKMVVCAMVKRAMIAGVDVEGVTNTQQTAGPFSQSMTYSNPMGNLYLTKAERKLLGCGGQEAFTVATPIAGSSAHLPWCSLAFGALYCSCGVDIAGVPIFGAGGGS